MTPDALAATLGALSATVEEARWRFGRVSLADYPGGRPSTVLELSGEGQIGFGELVSFSDEEHRAFAARRAGWFTGAGLPARGSVASLLSEGAPPHERAALESALIDLAMRQAGMSLGDLVGQRSGRVRWVVSVGGVVDPRRLILRRHPGDPRPDLKMDVHPGWTLPVIAALRDEGRVVNLDFKGQDAGALARPLSEAFPRAIFEDCPPGSGHPRLARDQSLGGAVAVGQAAEAGELVNLKGPRMGGFLELLRGLALVPRPEAQAYFGGMFEVGPGREQARQLAAIYCPDAPNDLAPLYGGASSLVGDSPSSIRLDQPGFGATLDWLRLPLW